MDTTLRQNRRFPRDDEVSSDLLKHACQTILICKCNYIEPFSSISRVYSFKINDKNVTLCSK